MDEASDFLLMAATLIEIKSRHLLPRPPVTEEENDPEAELIRRLEEYKRFKETANDMKSFEDAARLLFTKLPEEYPLPPPEIELTGMTIEGLTEAFLRILKRKPVSDQNPESNHYAPRNIHRDVHTVRECMLTVIQRIRMQKRMDFEEIFSEAPSREEVVTYFLALLELLKLGEIHISQEETYGKIMVISGAKRMKKTDQDLFSGIPDEEGRQERDE